MKPAAFFFDLDGTLVDTEMAWAQAIVAWMRDQGVAAEVDAVAQQVFGHSWPDIHTSLHAHYPALPPTTLASASAALRPYYDRFARDPAAQIISSSVAFLRRAARIAPCAIVSGSPRADVLAAAKLCGVADIVRFVFGAEDYNRGKPAPDGYLAAAMKLDVDASECVVVEDSTPGVAAGRAAGMHVLGLDRNPHQHQDFTGCDWLVHDLAELDLPNVFAPET